MAIKIKTYRVARSGVRGKHVALPSVWLADLNLKIGDVLSVYRDECDRLIICPPGISPNTDIRSAQARETAEAMGAGS